MPRVYTYGPFQSRRLGLSLGVNVLLTYKICTFNCVYCEIGLTEKRVSPTFKINSPPSANFRKELIDILKFFPHLNSITFGYNGEPTLNNNLLDFLNIAIEVRDNFNWKDGKPLLTLFTNSSTLHLDEIRERVREFEFVLAKLDVATEDDFKRTNRPHNDVPHIEKIINSLVKLKKEMPVNHKLAIQSLLYNSYIEEFISNNNSENINKLGEAIRKIKPDFVQVYSIARIPAEHFVYAISEDNKIEIKQKLKDIILNDNIKIDCY
jgi:wyosine [tRNA(Phe)-imidazoG37] synthetase (radical SAM superfamily)